MKKKKKLRIKKIINLILIFLAFLAIIASIFVNKKFNNVYFEQLLITITNSEGTGLDSISDIFFKVLILSIIFTFVYVLISYILDKFVRKDLYLVIKLKKEHRFKIFRESLLSKFSLNFIIFIIFIFLSLYKIGFLDYLSDISHVSTIFEEDYVNPKSVKVEFPENKRNLIFIYLESFEMTGASRKNGGFYNTSLIPEMEELALNNINFSNTSNLGGFHVGYGGNWTIGALVSSTSAVPLKVVNGERGNLYGLSGNSLPGAYSLGDLLADNGYKNYFMMGSDSEFGSRKNYLKAHGDYTIYDYYSAIDDEFIDPDYHVWWGYEDKKLFEYAKLKLKEISKSKEPFNFSMLTVDTHFVDGYLDETCSSENFKTQYENVIYCNDSMVYSFINWIKKQSFYKNTTIVVVGDHLTMQEGIYLDVSDNDRVVYNTIINSAIKDKSRTKNRIFTNLDLYPTTLASMGCKIKGDQLGLGVNLYSNKPTLAEKYGVYHFYELLSYRSNYYIDNIMKDSYYEMLEDEMNGIN